MPKLTLQRSNNLFRGGAFKIRIDGVDSGSITKKQTKEFVLPEGNHTLELEAGLLNKYHYQSQLNLSSDKILLISTSPVKDWVLIYIFAGALLGIWKKDTIHLPIVNITTSISTLIVISGFIALLYLALFHRRSYFIVKELKEINYSLL